MRKCLIVWENPWELLQFHGSLWDSKRVNERFLKFHCSVDIFRSLWLREKFSTAEIFQENEIILTIFKQNVMWYTVHNFKRYMHPDIARKYDLTISTDKAIVLIRPPGLVTLFLSLVGNVICNTFKNDRKSSNKRKPGLALFEHQSAAISTN